MSFLAKKHTGTTRITKLRSNANRMRFMIKTNNDRINLPEKPDSVGWISRGFFLFALPWVGVCSWGNVWFRRWLFLGDAQHLSVVEHIISIPWTRKFLLQNVYFAREQDKLSSALYRNMPYFLCLISCQIRLRPELYDGKTYYDNCTISVSSFPRGCSHQTDVADTNMGQFREIYYVLFLWKRRHVCLRLRHLQRKYWLVYKI